MGLFLHGQRTVTSVFLKAWTRRDGETVSKLNLLGFSMRARVCVCVCRRPSFTPFDNRTKHIIVLRAHIEVINVSISAHLIWITIGVKRPKSASLNVCDALYFYLASCRGSKWLLWAFFYIYIFRYVSICAVLDINYSKVKWPEENAKTRANKWIICKVSPRADGERAGGPQRVCVRVLDCAGVEPAAGFLNAPPFSPVTQHDGQLRHARSPNYNCWGVEC